MPLNMQRRVTTPRKSCLLIAFAFEIVEEMTSALFCTPRHKMSKYAGLMQYCPLCVSYDMRI